MDGLTDQYVEFLRLKKVQRRKEREAIETFVQAAHTGNRELFCSTLEFLELGGLFERAFRAVAGYSAPMKFRTAFARVWLLDGDSMRSQVNNDLVLIEALRVLLPPYTGGSVRLYRGDSACNRRRRTYGLSWTTDIGVARQYANHGMWRMAQGGSVVITTKAPPAAVISVPGLKSVRFKNENEYLVDRRRLETVDVVERFSQLTIEEHRKRKGYTATSL